VPAGPIEPKSPVANAEPSYTTTIARTASDHAGSRSDVVEAKMVADLTGPKILDVAAGRGNSQRALPQEGRTP
jgi:2-polyprenyl-3-methyl-5-hydroxy-6-metoxy-1,4-benzoquinol methylase